MIFKVHLLAFGGSKDAVRVVEIPAEDVTGYQAKDLDAIFKYGQNDFQPREQRSVSTGDVIAYGDNLYRVESFGFSRVRTL